MQKGGRSLSVVSGQWPMEKIRLGQADFSKDRKTRSGKASGRYGRRVTLRCGFTASQLRRLLVNPYENKVEWSTSNVRFVSLRRASPLVRPPRNGNVRPQRYENSSESINVKFVRPSASNPSTSLTAGPPPPQGEDCLLSDNLVA